MATFDTGYPILINFRQVRLKRLPLSYDANEWYILRNKESTGPVGPVVGNGCQLWSRILIFERVRPHQGRIEGPRSNISGYGM